MLNIKKLQKQDIALTLFLLFSIIISGTLACTVAAPAYKSPLSRTYSSKLGYSNAARKLNKAFPVKTEKVSFHNFKETHLGEGLMASQPILVPVIPMSKVKKLYVKEGQFVEKGQLLLEMDTSLISIKHSSAKLALETANSELGRVSIGSAYVLDKERPEKDKIDFTLAKKEAQILKEKLSRHKKLLGKGSISKDEFLELELRHSEAVKKLDSAKFHLKMSTKGQKQSIKIANNSLKDAENNLVHKDQEISHYTIHAPESGIIERVLIREGEYNQDSGRPAFVLASGLWFEAHLDQTSINKVKEGDKANVYLEAFPGEEFKGEISQIKRLVSYNAGGPEINRPIRPRGSSTPEWPSTFAVRIQVKQAKGSSLYPGLTGFAKILTQKNALSISKSALTSLSGSSAIIKLPLGKSFAIRSIRTGTTSEEKTEIVSGLKEGDEVIFSGHEILQKGDIIKISSS